MNNRGNIFDAFTIMIIVFMIGLMVVIGIYLATRVNSAIQDSGVSDSTKTMTGSITDDLPGAVDFVVIMILFGLPLVSVILAYFNNIHPVFFYIGIAVLILIVLCGYAYQQLWVKFTAGDLSVTSSSIPMTNFILSHFGIYSLFVGIAILYGLYVKNSQSGGM